MSESSKKKNSQSLVLSNVDNKHHSSEKKRTLLQEFINNIVNKMEEEDGIVKLISKEGEVHEVPISVAKMSSLVATTIDDDDEDDDEDNVREIPLPNVKNAVLIKVIEYCTHYKEEAMNPIKTPLQSSKLEELVQAWYVNFVKVEKDFLFELVTAANFMDIKPMLDLTVLAVCIFIKGKQASELREMFNISSELTPEEEAQVREENRWVEHPSNQNA